MVNATKERIDSEAALKLLASHKLVVAAKGKKTLTFDLRDSDAEDVLKAIMGPSGNLRAPSITFGKTLMVGFNDEMFESAMG